jgi:hypothetical protein
MVFYTQEELNSIWQKLTDGTEHDKFDELDVSAMVESCDLALLKAGVVTNTDTEQVIAFSGSVGGIMPYTDFDPPSDTPTGTYARFRDNKEGLWTAWKKS